MKFTYPHTSHIPLKLSDLSAALQSEATVTSCDPRGPQPGASPKEPRRQVGISLSTWTLAPRGLYVYSLTADSVVEITPVCW